MEHELRADTAPGESHIALRKGGVCYYSPSLFHMAPTHERIVPLTIRDLLKSKCLLEFYGVTGLKKHAEGYIMVGNYPVQLVKIRGTVLLYHMMEYSSRPPFYLISLEDYLGRKLMLTVKANCSLFKLALQEGNALEVVGKLTFYSNATTFLVDHVTSHRSFQTLEAELDWLQTVFAARKFLEKPWKYEAPQLISTIGAPKVLLADQRKSAEKQFILISDEDTDDEEYYTSHEIAAVDDSLWVETARKKRGERRNVEDPGVVWVLSDEEEP
ncbi:hypothetical protein PUMCH_002596 [Australozyma saopauloensis]|uniref:CST complex subunit Stn1 N-terminal domain-containing protein n=1 Tax=Australozyma saopauloensis TaxID=291208 RepID=A0AAX4H9S2_9ASCO|nr:hypothetical protein PUMCH_002596 [[Candida] saopauloensis]